MLYRHKWKTTIVAVLLVIVAGGIAWAARPKEPEYVTAVARRGELRQTVEAVGTVISEHDFALQFRSTGIVADVAVKEGDSVRAGQRLAQLRAGNLAAAVAAASARVQEVRSSLDLLRAGTRPEDIAVAEAQVENKRALLDAARRILQNADATVAKSQEKLRTLRAQASTNVSGEVTTAASTVSRSVTTASQALAASDDVFANNDVADASIRREDDERQLQARVRSARDALRTVSSVTTTSDYDAALNALRAGRIAISITAQALAAAYDFIASLQTSSTFTVTAQTRYKDILATQRNAVQSSLRDLDAAIAGLQNAPANLQTQIAAEEATLQSAVAARDRASADIATAETSIRIDEAQLLLKRAGARPEDITAAEARVRQAQADFLRAAADYGDTVLAAPAAGTVTKVHVQPGEATPAGPAIEMIGATPYRIEMFVSEVDVPKVLLTQSGSIELDAFRGAPFALRVAEIDPAATDRDGVPKYRIKLDFLQPRDELKIGMTGDAAIVTGQRSGVVIVPRRAVLEQDNRMVVRILRDGTAEELGVTLGMEGEGGEVEVASGLSEGEVIVVLEKN